MNIFTLIVTQPITNVLVAIYHGLIYLHTPHALGFSIIALTVLLRLLLYPLTLSQIKTQKKMQDIAPHLSKIKEKHKGDVKAQQQATMELYREHGLNPAAGCLPALLQLPIFFGLYGVLRAAVQTKSVAAVNKLIYVDSLKLTHMWDTTFFGLPLGKTPRELLPTVGVGILLVAITTGLLQFMQSKMMIAAPVPTDGALTDTDKDIKSGKEATADFSSALQMQTTYFLPIMIGVFSFGFPLGLSLYWNTFTLFGIIQQYRVSGWGGLATLLKRN